MKSKLLVVFFVLFSFVAQSLTVEAAQINLTEHGGGIFKNFQAWSKFRDGDYNDALRRYSELNQRNPDDAFYNYMLGNCYLALTRYDESIVYFENAVRLDPNVKRDLPLQAGLAYYKKGELDKALRSFNIYLTTLTPRQLQRDELIMDYINSILNAKDLKANPVNVRISKLSSNVNSDFYDASPIVSPDGKTMYFISSRIVEGFESLEVTDDPSNERIYVSHWDEETNTWGMATRLQNDINNQGHIEGISLSHDGQTIFIFRNIPDDTKSGEIYFSTRNTDDTWTNAIGIGKPINSSFYESSAAMSPDGNSIYFVSERNGSYGNADIYRSTRLSQNTWGTPENLSAVINSPYEESNIYVHPNGQILYFTSNGHRNMGGFDVFMSKLENGVWTQPVNMGYPINTEFDEKHFSLSADGNTAYISSNREGVFNIYEIDLTNYTTRRTVDYVIQYNSEDRPQPKYASGDNGELPEIDIHIINNENNEQIAMFNTLRKGEFAIKLRSDGDYKVVFINKDLRSTVANISTAESGEFIVKIADNDEIMVTVEKSWRHCLLVIKLIEKI
ncbi:MAG: tetratricopeptide repeat protein [Bacteroidales bacterium]|nr:tetratricopeptide repeat protein [Bacteroidales bacterium]